MFRALWEKETELSLEQNTLDLLSKANRALERVEAGTYGLCEACGKAIPIERLEALPYSNLCVECAARTS